MKISLIAFPALLLQLTSGCAISRPCAEGGDVSWPNTIKGNKQCHQKRLSNGSYVNDGGYVQWHPNGKIAVEGVFKDGRKHGVWNQYDETGRKILEKYYRDGVETSPEREKPERGARTEETIRSSSSSRGR